MAFVFVPAVWDVDVSALLGSQGWASRERHVTAPAMKLVLLCLADHANEKQALAWPSVETVAGRTGLDERTVRAALRKLVRLGLIEVADPSSRHRTTTYRLLLSRAGSRPSFDAMKGGDSPVPVGDSPVDGGQTASGKRATRPFREGSVPPDPGLIREEEPEERSSHGTRDQVFPSQGGPRGPDRQPDPYERVIRRSWP